ncbi:MAG: DUF533 domain-containing protein [Planctomycetaceae bacterium]
MNPIDILGGMLGGKSRGSGGGGLGGVLLDSILKGGRGAPQSSGRPQVPASQLPDIQDPVDRQEFDRLEDLLRHAHQRSATRSSTRRPPAPEPQRPSFPQPDPRTAQRERDFTAEYDGNPDPFNQQAQILVIAMINAAKADGQIDQAEQNAIIEQLGDLDQDEVHFLQTEFAKPLDVREFVWSVPLGMERQVYAVSLMAIKLDQNSEAQYLRDLGHGFRMTLDQCNQIHREFNAPTLR